MEDLFNSEDLRTEQFSNLSPEFRELIGELVINEQIDILKYLVILLTKAKKVEGKKEALEFLDEALVRIAKEISSSKVIVTYSDLTGRSRSFKYLKQLRDLVLIEIEDEQKPKADPHRFFGIVSHQAILGFLNKKLPNCEELRSLLGLNQEQLNLLSKGSEQKTFLDRLEVCPASELITDVISRKGEINGKLINRIKICYSKMSTAYNGVGSWIEMYSRSQSELAELEELLTPIFSGQIEKLKGYYGQHGEIANYLYLLTLMSWATAVIYGYQINRGTLFLEVPVIHSSYALTSGRMDALEVISIDGRPPSDGQCQLLNELSRRQHLSRFKSVGYLMKELFRIFSRRLVVRVLELKFAVGDALEGNGIIKSSQVAEKPFSQHQDQVLRYMALANVDLNFLLGEDEKELANKYFRQAQIIYFLPNVMPLVHEVELDEEGLDRAFFGQVVSRWVNAEERAKRQEAIKRLVRSMIELARGNQRNFSHKGNNKIQASLFPQVESAVDFLRMKIDRARRFVDETTKIIEIIGYTPKGRPRLAMHYDRLLGAIDSSLVETSHLDPETGGFIGCLSPDHADSYPSMRVDPTKGLFHCFGLNCRLKGKILPYSIPEGLSIQMEAYQSGQKGKRRIEEPVFSERHFEIMAMAQEILQAEFLRVNQGRNYLKRERRIDSELAYGLGIGYGNHSLIKELLERGATFEEMVYYGFLNFSSNIKPHQGICPIFLDGGLKVEEIQRETKKSKGLELPFSILDRRVTAPLTLPDGKITSFYGRAIWTNDKIRTHRKLKAIHGLLHGAFNMKALESKNPILIILEGFADLCSLCQMGADRDSLMALVGVDNYFIYQAIAKSGKKVVWAAFDNDESRMEDGEEKGKTGQRKTEKMFEELRELGFSGELANFTAEFMKIYPQCLVCKDFSQIFQEFGALSLGGLIQSL